MDFATRQSNVRHDLAEVAPALLVTHLPNIRYLCGFSGSAAVLLLPASGQATLITDGRYTQQARAEAKAARVVITKSTLFADAAKLVRGRALAIEAEHVTVHAARALQKLLPNAVRLKPTGNLVERRRMIKDAAELRALRTAVRLGSSVFGFALAALKVGVRENNVAGALEFAARGAGADGMSFETIVAAGKRSALPHGRASAARLPRRGFVVLDYGVILGGYCSDMTRTVHLGKPDAWARGVYEAVLEAQLAGIAAARPGVTAGQVDAAARKVLTGAGFGRFFTHSTGHGVGLEIHEAPRLAKGQEQVLTPGMVITIEPGAYVPGRGGVRIEDMVAVTDRGCDVLTPTTKELITV